MMDEREANELFRSYRLTGDKNLRNRLVENYFNIAEILAKKFSGRGVEYDDLLQIASEALIAGVEKFDPDLGNRFTTYVTPTITGMIKNYFRDFSRSVRLPRRVYAVAAKVREAQNEYYKETGAQPTISYIAEKLGYSEELIEKLDPTEKQVITLRYVQGKSQSEVGKILGVSQMFVSRAERKIVEKLKEALIS